MPPSRRLLPFRVAALVAYGVLFVVSIELLTLSFTLVGSGVARQLIASTANPLVGLFIGIVTTAILQSSSITTSLTVGLVAAGALPLAGALPIVLGANVGTSVTNTIVALGSISRPAEFRRAVEGATVHDFFNLLSVLVLFPLEGLFGVVSAPSAWLAGRVLEMGVGRELAFLAPFSGLVLRAASGLAGGQGAILLAAGLLLLVVSMHGLVRGLRLLVIARIEVLLNQYVFRTAAVAFGFGLLLTVLVQSSSVTTSLTVPLVAAGLLTARRIYPFVVGANVGTTVTALVAALVALSTPGGAGAGYGVAALNLAFAHLVFNLAGMGLFLLTPGLREVPLWLAGKLGAASERRRLVAVGYVLAVFVVIPVIAIVTSTLR